MKALLTVALDGDRDEFDNAAVDLPTAALMTETLGTECLARRASPTGGSQRRG